mmetsp:Transcript_63381/g.131846  ORF Transcript_63381/g.131846 Transcript_63381/m.131846 type:complete len:292 (+) Transcript_63381:126-1001(+)
MTRLPSDGAKALAQYAFAWAKAKQTEEPVCRVRCVDGEDKLSIKFTLNGTERLMQRKQSESLASTLARLKKTLQGKKAKNSNQSEREIWLTKSDGTRISDESLNQEAWQKGHTLHVDDVRFVITRNRPCIDSLRVKQRAVKGFGIQPLVVKEFADTVVFRWFSASSPDAWKLVSSGAESYVPAESDVGNLLKFEAVPLSKGGSGEFEIGEIYCCELPGIVLPAPNLAMESGEREGLVKIMQAMLLCRRGSEGGGREGGGQCQAFQRPTTARAPPSPRTASPPNMCLSSRLS